MCDMTIPCPKCDHVEVCALKNKFEKAQKAVDDLSVILDCTNHSVSTKKLRDFDWIEPVKLRCKHFANRRQPTVRNIEP